MGLASVEGVVEDEWAGRVCRACVGVCPLVGGAAGAVVVEVFDEVVERFDVDGHRVGACRRRLRQSASRALSGWRLRSQRVYASSYGSAVMR